MHCVKGQAEIENLDNNKKYTELRSYVDADLARDLATRWSTSSSTHEYNGVTFGWNCTKQPCIMDCTNGSEIKALFNGIKKTIIYRRFLEPAGRALNHL